MEYIHRILLVMVIVFATLTMSACSPDNATGGNQSSSNPTQSQAGNEGSESREGDEGSEHGSSGEHSRSGEGSEDGSESSEGSGESRDPSSPILALNESWDGVVKGIRIAMSYDPNAGAFSGIIENTTNQLICFVQIELNLKQDTTTVVELGPQPIGALAPSVQTRVELLVANEPLAAGVVFDAWEIHPEMFDCNGPGPVNIKGTDEGGTEVGDEQHGAGGEGGSEGGEGSLAGREEGRGANALALNETFDTVRNGARLILNYDSASNSFIGTVQNTTNVTLTRVRIEVHLSNSTELGPTTPTDLASGQILDVTLPATAQAFESWIAHAEVGAGEGGEGDSD